MAENTINDGNSEPIDSNAGEVESENTGNVEYVSPEDLSNFESRRDVVTEEEYNQNGLDSVWGSYSKYQEGSLTTTMPNEESFDVDVDNVECACSYLNKLSYELDTTHETLKSNYTRDLDNFCTKFDGSCSDVFPEFTEIVNSLNDLKTDLLDLEKKLLEYARTGDASLFGDNGSWLSEHFGINPFVTSTAGGGGGGYSGVASGTSTAGDVDTDIDTDVDVKPVTDDKNSISTNLIGSGIGSTLLGMTAGAAGVAGSGVLIDGDSVLDELDDTVVVPSIIKNRAAASIKKSKKDKVGLAVGVGLAAAAVGGGLYYYSKEKEEENGEDEITTEGEISDEDVENVITPDDSEDGADEFQYGSGLGNVVELREAILNDDL